MEVNKYQTPLDSPLVKGLNDEISSQLFNIINSVPFVQNLISPKREYAKDRPRDSKGRIIVDLANPHILEDMDYFRPTALYFKKHGVITHLRPNANPNSPFGKWLAEEKRRVWEGYVRESDGEWVSGYLYWYLNYSPIMITLIKAGSKKADRVLDFPEVWEGIYWRFHCMEQASSGGLYNEEGGQHMAELASRGKGKSFSLASILSHIFIVGENEVANSQVRGIVTAYQKEYLTKDGVLNKFIAMIDFCATYTQFPRKRLQDSINDMVWTMGYLDKELGTKRGTLNTILGVSSKDDESKLRGKRAAKILIEEFGCHSLRDYVMMADGSIRQVTQVKKGDFLMGDDHKPREVLEVHTGKSTIYRVSYKGGVHRVTAEHLIYFEQLSPEGNWEGYALPAYKVYEDTTNKYLVRSKRYNRQLVSDIDFLKSSFKYDTCFERRLSTSGDTLHKVKKILNKYNIPFNDMLLKITISRIDLKHFITILDEDERIPFRLKKEDIAKYRGFSVNDNNLYLMSDGIITHNSFPRLLDLYNVLLPSVQEGDYSFGQMLLVGTAGDSESDFAGAQEIMYNPKGYNMYSLPNVYDKIGQGKPDFVFFFPAYVNRKGCYNENGVSDVIKALVEILKNRHRVKYNSTDENTLMKTIAELPITPAEAIVKTRVNMFPVTSLVERLSEIDNNPTFYDDVYTGELRLLNNKEVAFYPSSESPPIRDFPHRDNKVMGGIEIYSMPEIDRETNKAISNRYILGCDTYDDDTSNTMSLGSVFVLDLFTDRIVAEYTGRPSFAEDFYEICRKLCLFYNGRMNYENNKKGLFSYFSKMNSLYLLTDQLESLKDKQLLKESGFGNKSKGTVATGPINNYARILLRNWLLSTEKSLVYEDEEEKEVVVPKLGFLKNRALIKELISYSDIGNFDRVSAMGMLMLLREDKLVLCNGDIKSIHKRKESYLGEDPFFSNNYG